MVDSIGPAGGNQNNIPGQKSVNNFYAGFEKPDEVKVNLAGPQEPTTIENQQQPQPQAPAPQVENIAPVSQPVVQPTYSSFESAANNEPVVPPVYNQPTDNHSSYKASENSSNLLPYFIIGAVVLLVVSLGTFFTVSAINKSKLKKEKAQLDEIKNELETEKQAPTELTLPVSETVPTSDRDKVQENNSGSQTTSTTTNQGTTNPVTQTPVETPAPTTSPADAGGNG